jgi:hypothetical protein
MAGNSNNVRIIGDMESFIDRLISHTEEENCTHSVMDLLAEFFVDNSNFKDLQKQKGDGESPNNSSPQSRLSPGFQQGDEQ